MVVDEIPNHLTQSKFRSKDNINCLICGAQQKLNRMRHHVARHILLALRGIEEEGLQNSVGLEPCGFCGLDGCFTQIINAKHPKEPPSIQSNCRYHYTGMNYKVAKKAAKTSPSTNVPIHCALCLPNRLSGEPHTIWKYNAMYHIVEKH
ncbi:hypothetical protein B0H14DRAFT_2233202, partial [Mycena olivaceomarginata]